MDKNDESDLERNEGISRRLVCGYRCLGVSDDPRCYLVCANAVKSLVKHLDLFSGIGGFALAARWVGWETIGFCEIDPYCQKVLRKHWPDVPIYEDIRELDGRTVGHVDIITGGSPCQPFSVAGKQMGARDDRDLWPEFTRLVRECSPQWAIGENVTGFIRLGLDKLLSDLDRLGYSAETFVIPALAAGALHERDRVWIAANTDCYGLQEREHVQGACNATNERKLKGCETDRISPSADAADPQCGEQSLGRASGRTGWLWQSFPEDGNWEGEDQPTLDGKADGIPARLDRLRGLGNAIVPQVAEVIFRTIDSVQPGQK